MNRINLLPGEARAKASRERGLIYMILVLVGVLAVLGGVYVWQLNTQGNKQEELANIDAQLQVEQARLAELQPYAALQSKRTSMTETAKAIFAARVPWSSILQQVSLVIPDNVRLTTLTCAVPAAMLPGPETAEAAAGTASGVDITFAGAAYTHRDVAEFMTRLGLIPQLSDVRLTSSTGAANTATTTDSDATTTDTKKTVSFTVTAMLRPYLAPPPTTVLQQEGGQ